MICVNQVSSCLSATFVLYLEAISQYLKIGLNPAQLWYSIAFFPDVKIPIELKDKREEDLRILDLLPRKDSVMYTLTEYLVRMQNDCINCANPGENR